MTEERGRRFAWFRRENGGTGGPVGQVGLVGLVGQVGQVRLVRQVGQVLHPIKDVNYVGWDEVLINFSLLQLYIN